MLSRLTLEQKVDLLGGVDGFYTRAIPEIGLPRLRMSDGPLGARTDGPATTMTAGIALAATWNSALAREVGLQIGRDARARGVHFILGPGVNIYRAPMNGRNFEYFGEDPWLSSRIAVAYIQGMQSQGVSATIKHFTGNNSEYLRHDTDSVIDERTLREIYLPAFEAAVKEAHTGSIMDSYNFTNGAHMSQNGYLNNTVAKKEWGFDGVMMSDWVSTYDGVASANGGLDLEMPAGDFMNRKTLLPAVHSGQVSEATIDDKVRRILRVAVRFGWIDHQQADLSIPRNNIAGGRVALQAAREGVVLLKNEGDLLPLNGAKIKTIAVIGPTAYPAVTVGGGSAQVAPFSAVSLMEGLNSALGTQASVLYNRGVRTWSQLAASTKFTTEPVDGQPGLRVQVFDNPTLAGSPASTRVDRHINHRTAFTLADLVDTDLSDFLGPDGGKALSGSSARWTGYIIAPKPETYEVFAEVPGENGGHRLFIDGQLILDDWKIRKAFLDQGAVSLSAGPHKVVFEKFWTSGTDVFAGTLRVGIAPEDGVVEPAARTMAAMADVVIVAAGFDAEIEGESGDRTFSLPFGQDQLIREMAAANKNTAVVVMSGGAVDVRPWVDRVPALLEAWYPGQEGGRALAEILLGEVNPSGRLPISYDRRWEDNPVHDSYYPEAGTNRVVYKEGVFVGYRGYEHANKKPLFPFGYGLSYTSFRYGALKIKSSGDAAYVVSFEVTNTGKRAGAEVAQVYIAEKNPALARPPKELKGFAKLELKPGETKTATVALDARAFAFYDAGAKQWKAQADDFDVLVGRSSADIELRGRVTLAKEIAMKP
jgi:beta-glucosidase